LAEANELFTGWKEFPPTNLLVKAIVEGLGGGVKSENEAPFEVPDEAMAEMQRSAASAIVAKAGNRLPMVRGKDAGLPKAPPVFDIEELRKRNAEVARRRAEIKAVKRV
jgi:hypothetical protein